MDTCKRQKGDFIETESPKAIKKIYNKIYSPTKI